MVSAKEDVILCVDAITAVGVFDVPIDSGAWTSSWSARRRR